MSENNPKSEVKKDPKDVSNGDELEKAELSGGEDVDTGEKASPLSDIREKMDFALEETVDSWVETSQPDTKQEKAGEENESEDVPLHTFETEDDLESLDDLNAEEAEALAALNLEVDEGKSSPDEGLGEDRAVFDLDDQLSSEASEAEALFDKVEQESEGREQSLQVPPAVEQSELAQFESEEVEEKEFIEVERIESIVESVLFASEKPTTLGQLKMAFQGTNVGTREIKKALESLAIEYAGARRGVTLEEVGSGYQLRTKVDNIDYLKQMVKVKPFKLSGPAMEVLAMAAYKQPVTKAEIDEIRGVESGHLLRGLMDRKLVKFAGKSDLPGKPMLYATTKKFLEIFGLRNLNELPSLQEIDALLPEGIGEDEEKEKLADLTPELSEEAGSSYSQGEDELEKISEKIAGIETSSEFFEEEKRRQKAKREAVKAQDIREALEAGEEVSTRDQRWLERYELRLEEERQAELAKQAEEAAKIAESAEVSEEATATLSADSDASPSMEKTLETPSTDEALTSQAVPEGDSLEPSMATEELQKDANLSDFSEGPGILVAQTEQILTVEEELVVNSDNHEGESLSESLSNEDDQDEDDQSDGSEKTVDLEAREAQKSEWIQKLDEDEELDDFAKAEIEAALKDLGE